MKITVNLVKVSPDDWTHQASKEEWSFHEAVFLACGYDPRKSTGYYYQPTRLNDDPNEIQLIMVPGAHHEGIFNLARLAVQHHMDNRLHSRFVPQNGGTPGLYNLFATPAAFVAWAKGQGIHLPEELVMAVEGAAPTADTPNAFPDGTPLSERQQQILHTVKSDTRPVYNLTQDELTFKLKVSRATLNKALKPLLEQGLILNKRGVGYYLLKDPPRPPHN
jgi:biotin operon repressor